MVAKEMSGFGGANMDRWQRTSLKNSKRSGWLWSWKHGHVAANFAQEQQKKCLRTWTCGASLSKNKVSSWNHSVTRIINHKLFTQHAPTLAHLTKRFYRCHVHAKSRPLEEQHTSWAHQKELDFALDTKNYHFSQGISPRWPFKLKNYEDFAHISVLRLSLQEYRVPQASGCEICPRGWFLVVWSRFT